MSSRHLVDPQLLPILDLAPDMTVSKDSLHQTRQRVSEMTRAQLEAADTSVTVSEHSIPARASGPDARIILYRPADLPAKAPVVLQIHGGGFLFGTAELGDPRNRAMAKSVGCVVAAVDYRLAPEAPYPAALDDCFAALLWLHRNADEQGLDEDRIAVRGESAGGGLAASVAMLARDLGGPRICLQLLVYPMLDDRTASATAHPYAGEFVWNGSSNQYAWSSWLGLSPGAPDVEPLAAPARAVDLSRLPPTLLATAALDMFVEENLEYARRLVRAGVPTELYMAPGAFHGFEAMVPDAGVSRRFIEIADSALKRAFTTG